MTAAVGGGPGRDGLGRTADGFVVFLATWTILANGMTLAGGSFRALCLASLGVPIVAALVLRTFGPPVFALPPAPSPERPLPGRFLVLGLAWAATIAWAFATTRSLPLLWAGSLPLLAALHLEARHAAGRFPSPATSAGPAVLLLALVFVAIALASHRPDPDDGFFANFAVHALDRPGEALLSVDGQHGVEGLPLLAPYYRFHALELLAGVISWATGLEVLVVLHFGYLAAFSFLAVVAHWLVVRRLGAVAGPIGLVAALGILLAWGDGYRVYGNFAFVRLWQGKSVLVSVIVPLLVHYALRFAETGERHDGWRLALANAAAVGCSSSGIVVAPIATGVTLLAAWPTERLSRLPLALAVVAYPLLAGAYLSLATAYEPGYGEAWERWTSSRALVTVMGYRDRSLLAIAGLLACPLVLGSARLRQAVSGILLLFVAVVWSPVWRDLVELFLPSNMVWRAYWALPVPLLLGVAVGGAFGLEGSRRAIAAVAATAGFVAFLLVPGRWTLAETSGTRLDWPGLKVPPEYAVAEAIVERAPRRSRVLAPEWVALWIPAFREHPYPIVSRPLYLTSRFPADEIETRRALLECVTATPACAGRLDAFADELVRRDVRVVAYAEDHPLARDLAARLAASGYHAEKVADHVLWSR